MTGIADLSVYVPHWYLDASKIANIAGGGGSKSRRSVASFDQDTTTLAVEAARGLPSARAGNFDRLWFVSANPTYADKTNACAIHAALDAPAQSMAADSVGSARSAVAMLSTLLGTSGRSVLVSADMAVGLAGSADEATHGDGAAAVIFDASNSIAELVGEAHLTEEFLDRWREPGSRQSRAWEERFSESKYGPLGTKVLADALKASGVSIGEIDLLVVTGTHPRAVKALKKAHSDQVGQVVEDDLTTLGYWGGTQLLRGLAKALAQAVPGDLIALLSMVDGADALVLRATDAISDWSPNKSIEAQLASSAEIAYPKFLRWRGALAVEPPRRPEPARPSASASARNSSWKFGFVASLDPVTSQVMMPPSRAPMGGGPIDGMEAIPMSVATGTVVTSTIDKLAYSPSPPIVFAVIDFDAGGRVPIELTDCDPAEIVPGARVEMTFRRLYVADGISNYFWKARPIRGEK